MLPPDPSPLQRFALSLLDFTAGTLWRVREDVWKDKLGEDYDQESTRTWHPGLSIRKKQPQGFYEMIPMLHGTSANTGEVIVKGLTPDKGDYHTTSFGHLAPASVRSGMVFTADKVMPGEKPEGRWHDHNPITKNHWKPRLNEWEHNQLIEFLRRRRLD